MGLLEAASGQGAGPALRKARPAGGSEGVIFITKAAISRFQLTGTNIPVDGGFPSAHLLSA